MKNETGKKYVVIIFLVVFIFAMIQQSTREMEVINSFASHSANHYEQEFSLVLNSQHYFYDDEELAEMIINGFVENSLEGMLFSFDVNGYPQAIGIIVYKNMNKFSNGEMEFELDCTMVNMDTKEYEIEIVSY